MNSATLVRPGLAEVLYKTVAAANKAISLYHNRELDGIPMNIQLISAPERSSTAAQSAKYRWVEPYVPHPPPIKKCPLMLA